MDKIKELTDFYMWMQENDYDHNIRERVEIKAEMYLNGINVGKKLRLHNVSQQRELFAEQDSKDFILWQRDRGIRRLENGKYKWREFEYNREFFLEKYLEDRNKANCG